MSTAEVSRGVDAYLTRTLPILWVLRGTCGVYIYTLGGWKRLVAFGMGGSLSLWSTFLGVSMCRSALRRGMQFSQWHQITLTGEWPTAHLWATRGPLFRVG